MNIIVCVKQVSDPEAPVSTFKLNPEAKRQIPAQGVPPVLNPFDENALEAALRIKDSHEAKISVVSMGQTLAKAVVRKSLAAGADELFLLEDALFDTFDSYITAYVLSVAIKKIGNYDLILTGRVANDTTAGQVGLGIAEILGIPSITLARKVDAVDSKLRVERVVSDGIEVIETSTPALVTVSSELGDLRSVPVRELMAALKKPLTTWKAQDLAIDSSLLERTTIRKMFTPVKEGKCEIIGGEESEAGVNLALRLRDAKII